MPSRLALVALGSLALAPRLSGQVDPLADRAVSRSLLVAAATPSSPNWSPGTSRPRSSTIRWDMLYSRGVEARAASPLIVAGVRSELPDSSGESSALIVGARLGVRPAVGSGRGPTITAAEVSIGARAVGYLDRPNVPDIGLELILGRGDFEERSRGTLGLRLPVEFVRLVGPGRVNVFLAPTVAWGRLGTRTCEDRGPNDNCGTLGVQLAGGPARFLLAGGMSVGLREPGVALSIAAQRLTIPGEPVRLSIGAAWTPAARVARRFATRFGRRR